MKKASCSEKQPALDVLCVTEFTKEIESCQAIFELPAWEPLDLPVWDLSDLPPFEPLEPPVWDLLPVWDEPLYSPDWSIWEPLDFSDLDKSPSITIGTCYEKCNTLELPE